MDRVEVSLPLNLVAQLALQPANFIIILAFVIHHISHETGGAARSILLRNVRRISHGRAVLATSRCGRSRDSTPLLPPQVAGSTFARSDQSVSAVVFSRLQAELAATVGHSQGMAAAAVAAAGAGSDSALVEWGVVAVAHMFWLGARVAEATRLRGAPFVSGASFH